MTAKPIRTYAIGPDISQERYDAAIVAITAWFAQSRKTDEPGLMARRVFQQCLDGQTDAGSPWSTMAQATLEARVRAKCHFDLRTMKAISQPNLKRREKRQRDTYRKREQRLTQKGIDPMLPDEVSRLLEHGDQAKYGDNPHIRLSSQEYKRWQLLHEAYLKQFPELRTVNASSELQIVCDLQIMADRFRLKALEGQRVAVDELAKITKELAVLKTALGIHPDQIAKRVKPKTEATIAEAHNRLAELGDVRLLRERFLLEQMLQLYQAYNTPSADGLGYQIDDAGFFAQTMCRTCSCAKCGHRNAMGWSVEEVEQLLIDRGLLEPLDVLDPRPESPDAAAG